MKARISWRLGEMKAGRGFLLSLDFSGKQWISVHNIHDTRNTRNIYLI